jgi:hypothetical protein
MRNLLLFISGWLLLVVPEFLRVYYIMPFPGSQLHETIGLAYFLHRYIFLFRIAGILLIAYPLYGYIVHGKWGAKIISIFFTLIALAVFVMVTRIMQADKMFLQPQKKILTRAADNHNGPERLVIGVSLNGDSRCYPIQLIGYHHQLIDTVGNVPLIITYCTVCRSGRVYSPFIDGKYEHFRLVGMDHFNAMLEDETTKSWWRQENGEAIAGPLKGKFLEEITSQQTTLQSWLRDHPGSKIMQPDPKFAAEYASLSGFDNGTIRNELEGTSPRSWDLKSWVVGVQVGNAAKAYDWIDLKKKKVINDTIHKTAVLIFIENDSMTFHAYNRIVNGEALEFVWNDSLQTPADVKTQSVWNGAGACFEGTLKGKQLTPLRSYQEFWHSWNTFHPNTTRYTTGQ